jgi:flagellar motor switch protein FliN/FliY
MSNDQEMTPEEGIPGTDNSQGPAMGTSFDGEAEDGVNLQDLGASPGGEAFEDDEDRTAADLEAVFDVPVNVAAVLGKSYLQVSQLLKLAPGAVLELDRKVGEAIDIYVNNRLVARGEVVMVEERLGVTMTEIIKGEGQ